MTNIIEAVTTFLGTSDAIGRLNDQASTKAGELERLNKELAALDKERRQLWIAQDVDGANVDNALATNEKKRAALAEKISRVDLVFSELDQRRRLAQDELDRKAYLSACEEMKEANTDTEQLTAEFRAAAAVFLEAAARSARSNQRKVELLGIMSNYAGATDENIVLPDWCEQIQAVDWSMPESFHMHSGREVLLGLRMAWQETAQRHGGAHDSYLLEKASEHFSA